MKTVAIIGGGAAAISTLYELVESLSKPSEEKSRIYVIEKSPTIGPGLAYSPKANDIFLLNLPYHMMSPIPKQPDHFAKWLHNKSNEPKWRPHFPNLDVTKEEFLPRKLFGIYLTNLAIDIQKKARENEIEVIFLNNEATNITKEPNDKLAVHLKSPDANSPICANSVVLCTGHLPPSQHSYHELKSKKGYFETPWAMNMQDIPIDEDVLILGTHLTAVDAILARADYLKKEVQNGYTGKIGKIISASRTGLLPRVISATASEYVRKELTLEAIDVATAYGTKCISLKELKRMFKAEMKRAYLVLNKKEIDIKLKKMLKQNNDPLSTLEREIHAAKNKQCRPWQTVLFSLYPIVPRLWEALEDEGKKEFLERYYSIWMTYLAAFPVHNAEKIYSLMKENTLKIVGGLIRVDFDQNTREFLACFGNNITVKTRYIINAAGQGHDIQLTDSVLFKNLLKNEFIMPHSLGGVAVDFKTLRVISPHKHLQLYIVGDQTWGACMATADLSQISNNQVPRVINSMLYPKKKRSSFETVAFHKGPPEKKRTMK